MSELVIIWDLLGRFVWLWFSAGVYFVNDCLCVWICFSFGCVLLVGWVLLLCLFAFGVLLRGHWLGG